MAIGKKLATSTAKTGKITLEFSETKTNKKGEPTPEYYEMNVESATGVELSKAYQDAKTAYMSFLQKAAATKFEAPEGYEVAVMIGFGGIPLVFAGKPRTKKASSSAISV